MSQQVNLYQPMFRKQQVVFSARTSLMLAAGFLVLLALWWLLLEQRVDSLDRQLQQQQALEGQLATRVTQLNAAQAEIEPDPLLVERIERLQQRAAAMARSRETVRRRLPDGDTVISARLESLARRYPTGLWLTAIEISDGGRQIALAGRMLRAPLLPEFLGRLGTDPAFAGLAFRALEIRAAGDETPGLEFSVSTRDPEPPR
ncbi:MAG: PilN domain-containing protein [Wenzhouxiangellaceae bacterium]